MTHCVLFRIEDEFDFNICKQHFPTYEYRTQIPANSCVIGRYSVLPFYQELEKELQLKGSYLINSYEQHQYIADIRNYYADIQEYTPKTYDTWYNLPEGQWVVKGVTNSRKHQWATHMFAEDNNALRGVICNLLDDTMIGQQGVVVREYVPLKQLGVGMNELPVTVEYRMFFYKEHLLAEGFYWSEFPDWYPGELPEEGRALAKKVARIIAQRTNFFVLDIALTEQGEWIVIEVNDGQMSGLSSVDPEALYKNLQGCLNADKGL